MSFRPGRSTDLVCPEPGSTTGRAIASLSLRKLDRDLAAFRLEGVVDRRVRALFSEFRRGMDALLPGRPKARVAILASPFVREPLERALRGEGDTALEAAATAGLFALQLGPGLSRRVDFEGRAASVFAFEPLVRAELPAHASFPFSQGAIKPLASWSLGETVVAPGAAPAFGRALRELTLDERRALTDAFRLLDAAASPEAAELARFFPLAFPTRAGAERFRGALGLSRGASLAIALDVVEALALEKLERYGRLVERDVGALSLATRPRVRRAMLRRLALVRHPVAETDESRALLRREDAAAARYEVPTDEDEALGGVVEELARLR